MDLMQFFGFTVSTSLAKGKDVPLTETDPDRQAHDWRSLAALEPEAPVEAS